MTADFEHDERVRYFIDLMDPVSVGGIGGTGPSNVVYRTDWSLNPLVAHSVNQWAGAEVLKFGNYMASDGSQITPTGQRIPAENSAG